MTVNEWLYIFLALTGVGTLISVAALIHYWQARRFLVKLTKYHKDQLNKPSSYVMARDAFLRKGFQPTEADVMANQVLHCLSEMNRKGD